MSELEYVHLINNIYVFIGLSDRHTSPNLSLQAKRSAHLSEYDHARLKFKSKEVTAAVGQEVEQWPVQACAGEVISYSH